MRLFPYLHLPSLLCGSFIWRATLRLITTSFCTTLNTNPDPLTKGLKSSVMALPRSSEHPASNYLHIYSHRFHINYSMYLGLGTWTSQKSVFGSARGFQVRHAISTWFGTEDSISTRENKKTSRTQQGAKLYS